MEDDVEFVPTWMPPRPRRPEEWECCGSGCVPCVFDIYEQDVRKWKDQLTSIEREISTGSDDCCLSPAEFRQFRLVKIQKETENTYRYKFSTPDRGGLNMKVGQHIVLRAVVNDSQVVRSYTPISPLHAKGYFEVIIKLYEAGLMSQHIKSWEVGSVAEWRGPFGDFSYIPNKFRYIGMLAAGTGITPLYQVACSVVDNEDDETFVRLVYACRTASEVLMKEELDHLSEFWNFTVVYVLSQDPDANQVSRYGDRMVHGRVTAALLSKEMPPACSGTLALICGTPSFNKDVIIYLQSIGYDDSMYFKF